MNKERELLDEMAEALRLTANRGHGMCWCYDQIHTVACTRNQLVLARYDALKREQEKLPNHPVILDGETCCGRCEVKMSAVGLGDCNGWRCKECGAEYPDIASYKMGRPDEPKPALIEDHAFEESTLTPLCLECRRACSEHAR